MALVDSLVGRPRLSGNPNVTPARSSFTGWPFTRAWRKTHIEGEIVTYLPDGCERCRKRLFLTEDTIGVHLENWPDRPLVWAFNDDVEKQFAVLVGRESRRDIEKPHRCDAMPVQLNPTPDAPISGSSSPNSVAILGPGLSCRTPGWITYLWKAPLGTLVGPAPSGAGTSPWRTSSHLSAKHS
jgi:hypothetical protein